MIGIILILILILILMMQMMTIIIIIIYNNAFNMGMCVVCNEAKTINTIQNFATLVTCEHAPVCLDCIDEYLKDFSKCPQCRTIISGYMSKITGKFVPHPSSINNGNNNNGNTDNNGNNGNSGNNANT